MRAIFSLLSLCLLVGAILSAQDLQLPPKSTGSSSQNTVLTQRIRLNSNTKLLRIPESENGVLILTSYGDKKTTLALQRSKSPQPRGLVSEWQSLPEIVPRPKNHTQIEDSLARSSKKPALQPRDQTLQKKSFFLQTSNAPLALPSSYTLITGNLLAEGLHVRVYLDSSCLDLKTYSRVAKQIINCLDREIIPRGEQLVGSFADVDRDGKLSVLLSPHLDTMHGGAANLKGFVRSSDFRENVPRPFSNHSDVIYINSECPADTNYHTLLAHEYWHVLQFSHRLVHSEVSLDIQDDWICEGTAHLAEHALGGDGENLSHRINAWMKSPEDAPLCVPNYYDAGLWRHDGCRGGLYLFFRWCEITYGPEILTSILTSTQTDGTCLETITETSLETLSARAWVSVIRESQNGLSVAPESQLVRDDLFPDVDLRQLEIHELSHNSRFLKPISPTASTFVRVQAGDSIRIKADQSLEVRVIFVPIDQATQLAEKVGRLTETERRATR